MPRDRKKQPLERDRDKPEIGAQRVRSQQFNSSLKLRGLGSEIESSQAGSRISDADRKRMDEILSRRGR